jgi:hypothetical protein
MPDTKNPEAHRTLLYEAICWTGNAFQSQEQTQAIEEEEISTLTQVKLYRPIAIISDNKKERDL